MVVWSGEILSVTDAIIMPSNSECIMQYILLDSALHGLFYAFSIRAICGHPKFDYWKLPLLWHVPKGREYEIFKPLHGYFFRHKNPLSGNRTICIDLRVNLFFSSTLLLFVHLLVLIMSTILYRIRFADLICERFLCREIVRCCPIIMCETSAQNQFPILCI